MAIAQLSIVNFRNIQEAVIEMEKAGVNLVYGPNGSGKTSLLESIYYLSLGRSFRGTAATQLIRQQADYFLLSAHIKSAWLGDFVIGVERPRYGKSRMRKAGEDVSSITELAACLPLLLLHAQSHQFFELGPLIRRHYIDRGLFYHIHDFIKHWRYFVRTLKQRNAFLQQPYASLQDSLGWTEEFVRASLRLDQLRRNYVAELLPLLRTVMLQVLPLEDVTIQYESGWDDDQELLDVLRGHYPNEKKMGYTLFGPHRADFNVHIQGQAARHRLSRGQQKLLIYALVVAQGQLLARDTQHRPIYLLDDLTAELDRVNQEALVGLLTQQNAQIFITTTAPECLVDILKHYATAVSMFHVKHGEIAREAC